MEKHPYIIRGLVWVNALVLLLCLYFLGCRPSSGSQELQPADTLEVAPTAIETRMDSAIVPWLGSYGYEREDGRDPVGAQIIITYSITIGRDSCFYGGIGYQTYFKMWVQPEVDGDTLRLKLRKLLEGDSNHEPSVEVGKLYREGSKFWFDRTPYEFGDPIQMDYSKF